MMLINQNNLCPCFGHSVQCRISLKTYETETSKNAPRDLTQKMSLVFFLFICLFESFLEVGQSICTGKNKKKKSFLPLGTATRLIQHCCSNERGWASQRHSCLSLKGLIYINTLLSSSAKCLYSPMATMSTATTSWNHQ